MRIVLVGAKDSGKRELANKLQEKLGDYKITPSVEDFTDPFAIGPLADYRTELTIAIDRVYNRYIDNLIQVNSLIDSFAYSATRLMSVLESDNRLDITRWLLTNQLIVLLIRDSFETDVILFLESDPKDIFDQKINGILKEELNQLNVSYTTLEGNLDEQLRVALEVVEENGTVNERSNQS